MKTKNLRKFLSVIVAVALLNATGMGLIQNIFVQAANTVSYIVNNNAGLTEYTADENLIKVAPDLENITKYTDWLYYIGTNAGYRACYKVTKEQAHSGTHSLKYSETTATWKAVYITVSGLQKNKKYTFSFYAKGDVDNINDWKFLSGNSNGAALKDYTTGTATSGQFKITDADWKQYSFVINTGDTTELSLILMGAGGTVYYDDFALTETQPAAAFVVNNSPDNAVCNADKNLIKLYPGLENVNEYTGWLYDIGNNEDYKACYTVTKEQANGGRSSLKYSEDEATNKTVSIGASSLSANTQYVISFYAKGNVDTVFDWQIVSGGSKGKPIKDLTENAANPTAQYCVASENWQKYCYIVNTGDATSLDIVLLGAGGTVYYDDFAIFKQSDSLAFIENNDPPYREYNEADNLITTYPGLENVTSYKDWLYHIGTNEAFKACYSVTDEKAHTGKYSLKYSEEKATWKAVYIDVKTPKANTNYTVSFYAMGNIDANSDWKFISSISDGATIKDYTKNLTGDGAMYKITSEKWTKYSYIVNSGKAESVTLILMGGGGTIYFDDFSAYETSKSLPMKAVVAGYDELPFVNEKSNNLLQNGDFSNVGETFDTRTGFSIGTDPTMGFDGKPGYLEYKGNDGTDSLYTKKLEGLTPKAGYVFSYRYYVLEKGEADMKIGLSTDAAATPLVFPSAENSENGIRTLETLPGWKQESIVFTAGDEGDVYLCVGSTGNGGHVVFDNFELYRKENGVELREDNSVNIRPKNAWTATGCIAPGYSLKDGINSSKNLIPSGDFETMPQGSWNNKMFLNGSATLTNEEAYDGNTSLKFSANGDKMTSGVFWVTLKPNTMYAFQVMCKSYGLSEENSGDLQFGIISSDNGMFVPCPDPEQTNYTISQIFKNFSATQQLSPTGYDGYWHPRGAYFVNESDTEKTVGITIMAKNTTVYFDDFILTEAENLVFTTKVFDADWETAMTEYYPTKSICKDKDNLISDGMLKTVGEWQNNKGYGSFLEVNTTTNRLVYTDDGQHRYYWRWFDVKPNTEYTFSVYCKGEKEGAVSFGLCDSKSYGNNTIGKDKGVFKPLFDGVWDQYSLSFNSEKFSKIGFFIYNGGGQADFAKFRLFETENGIEPTATDIPIGGKTRVIEDEKPKEKQEDTVSDDEYYEETDEYEFDDSTPEEEIVNDKGDGEDADTVVKKIIRRRKKNNGSIWDILLPVGGGVIGAGLIAFIIILLVKKKRKKKQ